jgi:hypothetical protein
VLVDGNRIAAIEEDDAPNRSISPLHNFAVDVGIAAR